MPDQFVQLFQALVPEESLAAYASGDFLSVLSSPQGGQITQSASLRDVSPSAWLSQISSIASNDSQDEGATREIADQPSAAGLALLSAACLDAFLQSNVTGPPLAWKPSEAILPTHLQAGTGYQELHRVLTAHLSVDGEAVYARMRHVELFGLAKELSNRAASIEPDAIVSRRVRFRVNSWHQRLLSEVASSLQKKIREDADFISASFSSDGDGRSTALRADFLLERASVGILHGEDKRAREDLEEAARISGFHHVLTGRLGRRTKFQTFDTSQLVVLAKSRASGGDSNNGKGESRTSGDGSSNEKGESRTSGDGSNNEKGKSRTSGVGSSDKEDKSRTSGGGSNSEKGKGAESTEAVEKQDRAKPENLDLNDDTLLEKISFAQDASPDEKSNAEREELPAELQGVDAGHQPMLEPLDSINLLLLASSITNTSPDHGLTREETLPYAVRVLDGGSSNWQIYSQALLVRSRIEAHRSRTVERGVLQMQALVDQVIAETTAATGGEETASDGDAGGDANGDANGDSSTAAAPTTFLPRPKPSEAASAEERLRYIHALASPTRWSLEAELAERWVSVGGLKTALEIYERLEMWAETALCYASLEEDKKARSVVTRQLYEDEENKKEKEALPNDAPRLFCILGDIDDDVSMYERAWEVSNKRYAKAQRSLGRFYLKARELTKADTAYSLSLAINPQNSGSWFSLGCIKLELRDWKGAVEAFGRVVQREQDDAEAWSNLAAALLRMPAEEEAPETGAVASTADSSRDGDTEDRMPGPKAADPQKHAKQAFVAFKRAAGLKRDSHRIWRNVLNVAATLSPPPYGDIVMAQTRIIELRGSTEGEGSLDVEVLEGLLNHIIEMSREREASGTTGSSEPTNQGKPDEGEDDDQTDTSNRRRPGLEKMFIELMTRKVTPLITHSPRLWKLTARLSIYLDHPSAALDAYEKAWRATLNQPGWDNESGLGSTRQEDPSSGDGKEEASEERIWQSVVEATIELVDAYESLGEREVTEGLKAGSGELVCKGWRQKARMAIRSVLGRRAKAGREDVQELRERMEMLRS